MDRSRRTTSIVSTLCALLLPVAAIADGWQEDYDYALRSLEREQYAAAIGALENAIGERPEPARAQPGEADYLPYLHLAIAHFENGNAEAARKALSLSDLKGVAGSSYLGSQLRDRYALVIMATDERVVADAEADYREFERRAYVLSEGEAESIRSQVLKRCALAADVANNTLPWYFHYEYGVELMQAGDAQRALDSLILAANLREDSKRNSRMYGMWFTNYLPYWQIAQAHSKLGNWRCAMDAMRISTRYGEFSPVDPGFEEYSDLQQLIMRQNEAG